MTDCVDMVYKHCTVELSVTEKTSLNIDDNTPPYCLLIDVAIQSINQSIVPVLLGFTSDPWGTGEGLYVQS